MKKALKLAALTALMTSPMAMSAPAFAYDHHDNDRDYRGGDHHHHRCGGGNGAVGTVAGGAGGALAGNALGGGTLGTVAGGVGGALIGRHFDKQHTRHERGC